MSSAAMMLDHADSECRCVHRWLNVTEAASAIADRINGLAKAVFVYLTDFGFELVVSPADNADAERRVARLVGVYQPGAVANEDVEGDILATLYGRPVTSLRVVREWPAGLMTKRKGRLAPLTIHEW